MKKLVFCLAIMGLLALGGQAIALPGTIDDVPAATLLLPYFEVDLDNSAGITTLFSVNNASAAAQLAHVTVWSTWSIPVLDFDVYLTGYDVQSFNLRDILVDGILPQTGSGTTTAANDPGSPLGSYSFADVIFPNCNTTTSPPGPPVYAIPAITTTFRSHLRALLTGRQSPVNGTCAGTNYGDNIARGYITVDDSNSCTQLFPSDVGYFVSGGLGIADNDNVLWGDYFYVNPGENFAQGETLVHVEADAAVFNTPGDYTFYGRYILGTAADNREPLATTFAARYLSGGGPTGEPTPGAQCTFCDEAQRVQVGGEGIQTNADFGWLYLNLNHATSRDATLGAGYINIAQAWVTTVMDAEGRFSVGFDAIQLDNASTAIAGGVVLPVAD